MKISICIPTYNRATHLRNCLNSIVRNRVNGNVDFQVCVSDNCSTDETEQVVRCAQKDIDIKYHKNVENIGIPRNFINVVDMADSEFVWLIGDDDLLMPSAIENLAKLITDHPNVDFFYVNSFHLTTEYVLSFPQPFDTENLPKNMVPFSSLPYDGEMRFMDMINPKVSFDFLGGMFLSVFRREKWISNIGVLDSEAIKDARTFSHFDNTFPHVKVFAKAFSTSTAFFNSKPLGVCLTGAREWAPMYPFVRSVRLVDALGVYLRNGLPYMQYVICKNYSLRHFIPDLVYMMLNRQKSGYAYISPLKLFISNCLYPNLYLSPVYYIIRKAKDCAN